MKTEKQIEEMAKRVFNTQVCQEWLEWQDSNTVEGLELLAIDIAKQAQKDLLAESSEGFEEWNGPQYEHLHGGGCLEDIDFEKKKEVWQASRLPLMKKIEELEKNLNDMDGIYSGLGAALEKRRGENENLQKENRELREALDFLKWLSDGTRKKELV